MKKKMNTKTFIYLVSDKDMLSDYNCFFYIVTITGNKRIAYKLKSFFNRSV